MNFYAIGFVAVLGVAGLGVDYHQQSAMAGVGLGKLGVGDYFATYSARIEGAKAEKMAELAESQRQAAWREGPRPYLPEAPAGWTRRGLDEGINDAIIPAQVLMQDTDSHAGANYLARARLAPGQSFEDAKPASGIAKLMGERSAADIIKDVASRSWVYERSDETVFVEVRSANPPNLNSMAGKAETTMNAIVGVLEGKEQGYGVIGGVPFIELLDSNGERANHYRILNGTLGFGQEVRIIVHANAGTAATREILSAIDFDGMNAMLVTPMASVGNDMTPPPGVDEAELAEEMVRLKKEFDGLMAAEAQYRVKNMNAGALVIKTMARGYGAGDGLVDITGGQAVNMETLIRAGFRQGMRDLMEGGDGRTALGEVGTVFGVAVAQHQSQAGDGTANEAAAVMPKMSDALAAELGVVTRSETAPETDAAAIAENEIAATDTATAAPAPSGGGFIGKLTGLFGGGNATNGGNAAPKVSREKVEIRRLGGGGTRLASGGGCGRGNFCQANGDN